MLRKFIVLATLSCLLLLMVGIAAAQDTPAQPIDNLCDAGQAWDDGRCNIPGHDGASALAWECGYYMARVLDGRLSASDVPTQCEHLVKRALNELCRSTAVFEEGFIACIRSDGTGSVYFDVSQFEGEELPFDITVPFIEIRFFENEPQESDCPVLQGFFLVDIFMPGYFGVFTAEERASLGIGSWMCFYINEDIFNRS